VTSGGECPLSPLLQHRFNSGLKLLSPEHSTFYVLTADKDLSTGQTCMKSKAYRAVPVLSRVPLCMADTISYSFVANGRMPHHAIMHSAMLLLCQTAHARGLRQHVCPSVRSTDVLLTYCLQQDAAVSLNSPRCCTSFVLSIQGRAGCRAAIESLLQHTRSSGLGSV